jgi:hypothetical protein
MVKERVKTFNRTLEEGIYNIKEKKEDNNLEVDSFIDN